jgi:N-acetylglucosamine kinase-like BadF-type ATPase
MSSGSGPEFVLGIEGGGTKTDWIYLNHRNHTTEILRTGRLPSSNLKLTSGDQLKQMLAELPMEVSHVGIFLAGCVTEQDRKYLLNLAKEVWPHAKIKAGSDR